VVALYTEPWQGQSSCFPAGTTVQARCVHFELKAAAVSAVGRVTRIGRPSPPMMALPVPSLATTASPTGMSASLASSSPALADGEFVSRDCGAALQAVSATAPTAPETRTARRDTRDCAVVVGASYRSRSSLTGCCGYLEERTPVTVGSPVHWNVLLQCATGSPCRPGLVPVAGVPQL
jgi:hypothetical protein